MIELSNRKPFANGGNRLCFIDPADNTRCIKVARPGFSPAEKRARKGFPKRLKPLSSFNDNLVEFNVLSDIHARLGDEVLSLIPACYGMVDTDLGPGISTNLVTDADGKISLTMTQFIWEQGLTEEISRSIEIFCQRWLALAVPSRDILLHNTVVKQAADGSCQLVVIDGLGWSDMIPFAKLSPALARFKARRKIANFRARIEHLLAEHKAGGSWGIHGFIDPEKRELNSNESGDRHQ